MIIAIPSIGNELTNITPLDLIWVIIGYQLILAAVLVNFGRLGDIFGRVRLYKLGFAIFTIFSGLCSISQTGLELVVFRCFQGLGAGLLQANSNAIVTDSFGVQERGMAFSVNNIAGGGGMVLGLVLGGVLTGVLGWRSIFWVNIPIGGAAVVWSHFRLKELGEINRKQKVDIAGNITFLLGLILLLVSVTFSAISLLDLTTAIATFTAGAFSMALFIYIESKTHDPMIDLKLLKIPNLALGNVGAFMNNISWGAVMLVVALFLQGPTMKLSSTLSGLYIIPLPAAFVALAPVAGYLSDRHGQRILTTTGPLIASLGCVLLAQLGATATFSQLMICLALCGMGMGFFVTPNRVSVMNAASAGQRGVAGGLYQTSVSVGAVASRAFVFVIMALILSATNVNALFDGTFVTTPNFTGELVSSLHLVYYASALALVIAGAVSALRVSTSQSRVISSEITDQ
ncbi:MAG: MFS transporter [Nitrososphaerota archaeon]|nr:MFS transporter [Nitrososphaerota archaeon]MDG6921770.1 MFS transporter [Nitrososphaerota archaeon]